MTAARALATQRAAIAAQHAGTTLRGTDLAGFYRPPLDAPKQTEKDKGK